MPCLQVPGFAVPVAAVDDDFAAVVTARVGLLVLMASKIAVRSELDAGAGIGGGVGGCRVGHLSGCVAEPAELAAAAAASAVAAAAAAAAVAAADTDAEATYSAIVLKSAEP